MQVKGKKMKMGKTRDEDKMKVPLLEPTKNYMILIFDNKEN